MLDLPSPLPTPSIFVPLQSNEQGRTLPFGHCIIHPPNRQCGGPTDPRLSVEVNKKIIRAAELIDIR